ncbi:MAG TPA: S8 family serine peptidase [Actinomycetes bacterium]|nr:S8 family serine peptidase [Actinomycetes bacterium]
MRLSSTVAAGTATAVAATFLLTAATMGPRAAASPTDNAKTSPDPDLPVLDLGFATQERAASTSGRLLVKLSPRVGTSRSAVREVIGARGHTTAALGGRWYSVDDVEPSTGVRRRLVNEPGVVAVERERVRQAFGDQFYRRYQPYLRASMDVNQAWRRSTGRGVKVAVLDTGVDAHHEDLPRVLRGRDFVSGDRTPQDPVGHGTFVAGVIAAERDNHKGIAGVSRASILPGRVLNARGRGRDGDIARAIRWAVRERADLINLSLGGRGRAGILRDAIRFATKRGVLVVASAGNSGGTRPMYPAAYTDALAVGATDLDDRMVFWSQHGSWVDVVAPGELIASTFPGDAYRLGSGTSFSAPLVSGAAALVADQHPRWGADKLRQRLLAGAADAGPVGPDDFTGLGVPDVDGMLGGDAKNAVPLTGPLSGTSPANARPLQKDSTVPASSPEGTDRWFELEVSTPTKVRITATLRSSSTRSMRGDVELTLYDSAFGRLDVANERRGAGTERVTAVVDDNVFVRVHNRADTRWPRPVALGFTREAANPGAVETGGSRRPVLVSSDPLPESYKASRTDPIELITGVDIQPASIDARSVRLVDGQTGGVVASTVSPIVGGWLVTPDASLASERTYALVLEGLRTTTGLNVPSTRVGFKTQS